MQTLGLLTAGVAHELNTPLSVLRSNAKVLAELLVELEEAPDKTAQAEIIEECHLINNDAVRGIEQVIDIVSAIAVFNKDQAKFEVFDIRLPIEHAIKLAWNQLKYDVMLTTEFSENLMVNGQLGQLVQVFVNLLVNACQAMAKVSEKAIQIETKQVSQQAHVIVSDAGLGISGDAAESIFEPFFTTKTDGTGTGLGLAISRDILVKHGGSLALSDSKLGGATFVLTLPLEGNHE